MKLFPNALAEREKMVDLFYSLGSTGYSSISEKTNEKERHDTIRTITLDDVGKDFDSVKMIKIDTEGYDLNVLRGGKNILTKTKYVVIEDNSDDVRDFLTDLGYIVKNIGPSTYLLAINSSC